MGKFCEENNIIFIAHSPVGGHSQHAQRADNSLLKRLAEKYDTSTYQIMIAWLLHSSSSLVAIPGETSKTSSITDSLRAINVDISQEDMQPLETEIK